MGLALLSSRHVLIIWSQNALRSDYVRAEILLAAQDRRKELAAYMTPGAPTFPISSAELVYDDDELSRLLERWQESAKLGAKA